MNSPCCERAISPLEGGVPRQRGVAYHARGVACHARGVACHASPSNRDYLNGLPWITFQSLKRLGSGFTGSPNPFFTCREEEVSTSWATKGSTHSHDIAQRRSRHRLDWRSPPVEDDEPAHSDQRPTQARTLIAHQVTISHRHDG